MRLYIDKENIESMVKAKNENLFFECTRLIRKGIDVHYNFPKSEFLSNSCLKIWFENTRGHGVNNSTEYSDKDSKISPQRPFSIEIFEPDGNADIEALYLLKDTKDCQKVEKYNCVFIGGIGTEYTILQNFIDIEDSIQEQANKISAWDVYFSNVCPQFPLTDIVIADPYYFKNKAVYLANNNDIIRSLASSVHNFPINLVIFTDNRNIDYDINLNEEVDAIRDVLAESTENEDCNVTIITEINKIHDRNIITNYLQIKSGSGFQIKNNGVKNDVFVQVLSRASINNEKAINMLLENYQQECVTKALKGYEGFNCLGDRVSNLIDF